MTAASRTRLETELQRARERLAALTDDFDGMVSASRDINADDEHDPEGATIAFERSQVSAVAQQVRAHVQEVEAALERLDAGTYGVCVRCGAPIGEERLAARPAASTCIRCAART